jgi:hypothetical protein
MLATALSGWRTWSAGALTAVAASAVLSACGSQGRQDAQEPNATFPVQVTKATWKTSQHLSEHTHLVIAVRNAGNKTIPDVAVTIVDPQSGTSVAAFGQAAHQQGLASRSRPVWIVDRPPGPCAGRSGYSCLSGGPGGAVTAYSNTWALGRLAPGRTATFDWTLTAISPGKHHIQYQVAAGLNGKAKARLPGGALARGDFTVNITSAPQQSYVNNSGQIVAAQ